MTAPYFEGFGGVNVYYSADCNVTCIGAEAYFTTGVTGHIVNSDSSALRAHVVSFGNRFVYPTDTTSITV